MNSTLTLRKAIWNQEVRRSVLNSMLARAAQELEDELKDNIDNSTPAGRLYARSQDRIKPSGIKGKRSRVITQSVVFRASAMGQPPARRFNTLYNSLKVRRSIGKMSIIAEANAPGAAVLDDVLRLNRPFFRSVISSYRNEKFVDRVRSGIRELL